MGGASSAPAEIHPISLIDFKDFKECGQFPSLVNNKKIIRDVSGLNLSDAFVIYVSHVWLRSRPSQDNFKDHPRPDSEDNEHYNLCVAGIESLLVSNKVALKDCYLWIDCSCLPQRDPAIALEQDPAKKIKVNRAKEVDRQIGQIMYYCDCMFTPDAGLADFARTNIFADQKIRTGRGHIAYLNRGWCLLEMFYSSFIPLSQVSQRKQQHLGRAVDHAFDLKRRPHFVYGPKEQTHGKVPLVVPAMRISSLKSNDPLKGYFTHDEDVKVVRTLLKELTYHYMKPEKLGYKGNTDDKGLRHGHGRYVFPSGGVYEGGYQGGLKHGYGRFEMASGDVYDGGYKDDRREGHGVFKFANGDFYEGTWFDGKPNGQGKVEYATGDVYEGHFKNHMKHGFGIFTFATGCQYEGWYKDDLRHGQGKYVWGDGDSYDGEWKDHVKHGYGEFRFASGAYYQGMWREDSRHGKGKYRLMNGELYEGEYKNDMRDGEGTYLFRSGAKYDGTWRKHLKNGMGKLYSPNGNELVYDGEWIDDKPQGYVDPLLIFEDDIQYMEVMDVIKNAETAPPSLKKEPTVLSMEPLMPSAAGTKKVKGEMTEEYFNDDGVLDEDDDFHPKNLFRRKSEDWIDKEPQWSKTDLETMQAFGVDNDEEKNEYMQEFQVEKEIVKNSSAPTGMVDVDKHDKPKKMFSPVRKVIQVRKLKVTPVKEKPPPLLDVEAKEEMLSTEMDETSVDEASARR